MRRCPSNGTTATKTYDRGPDALLPYVLRPYVLRRRPGETKPGRPSPDTRWDGHCELLGLKLQECSRLRVTETGLIFLTWNQLARAPRNVASVEALPAAGVACQPFVEFGTVDDPLSSAKLVTGQFV